MPPGPELAPPLPPSTARRTWLVPTILALVVLIAAAAAVYTFFPQYFMPKTQSSYTQGQAALIEGAYDQAIQDFTRVIANANDKSVEGKAKILLASAYARRKAPGDEAKSMQLYKEIISDYQIPAQVRALALNTVAGVVKLHNPAFYALYFPEEPYSTYLPVEGDNTARVNAAYLELLKLSLKTYETSYANYTIAGTYYAPLLGSLFLQGRTSEDQEVLGAAQAAKKYVEAGDAIGDSSLYTTLPLLESLLARATGISSSQSVLDTMPIAEREEAYQRAMEVVEGLTPTELASPIIFASALRTRFFYANFLMEFVGESRNEDIRELLAPYGTATAPNLIPGGAYAKSRAADLASISADLASYAANTGYTF